MDNLKILFTHKINLQTRQSLLRRLHRRTVQHQERHPRPVPVLRDALQLKVLPGAGTVSSGTVSQVVVVIGGGEQGRPVFASSVRRRAARLHRSAVRNGRDEDRNGQVAFQE